MVADQQLALVILPNSHFLLLSFHDPGFKGATRLYMLSSVVGCTIVRGF